MTDDDIKAEFKAWGERIRKERESWTPEQRRANAAMLGVYYLDEQHNVIPADDSDKWAEWLETHNRRVRLTRVGPYFVSTVFLGLDHNHARFMHPELPPLLFETMAWTNMDDTPVEPTDPTLKALVASMPEHWHKRTMEDIQERCSTWAEALEQHQAIVDQYRADNLGDDVEEIEERVKEG